MTHILFTYYRIFVCLVYMWGIHVFCTCVDVSIHTYAEMQIILAFIFYHFLLCVLSHTAWNLELMVTAGWPVSASPRSARVGLVITVRCHAPFIWVVEIQTQVLISARSTLPTEQFSLAFIHSFVSSFVHSSKTRLAL